MASLLFYGSKLAACGLVLSIWGVIMLAMLGIFFTTHSAVLIEDVPFTEKDFNFPHVGIGFLSFYQVHLNKRKEYLVH
ncbi:ribonuclease kappa-A-like [Carassius auratus]|uniref:Ribonuclease kappa-A-like n=1 Tax=Carassius auratus TaxID=7957 RepID=A0A6P6KIL3_CARAU|nr:ribonuclease kappa-A-like [Carassius auratus]XP_052458218.1 ribonuclease kappa-A [Carassius gibelio]